MKRVETKLAVGALVLVVLGGCSGNESSTTPKQKRLPLQLGYSPTLRSVADDLAAEDQAIDVIYSGAIAEGQPIANLATAQPERFNNALVEPKPESSEPPPKPRVSKIAAELLDLVTQKQLAGEAKDLVSVLVLFKETIKIPRFPAFREDLSKEAPANAESLTRAQQIIERLTNARQPEYAARELELKAIGTTVQESFWLINAQRLELPIQAIEALAARADVVSVDPVLSGGVGINQLVDSRALLSTDPYFNLNLTAGYIASIDSGVRQTHTLFNFPPRLTWVRDCVNGLTNNCGTGTGLNPADETNHGTGVISILSGNTNQGPANRGLTGILVDSFRATNAAGGIYGDAFIRGYQAAVGGGDKVITTSLQRWEDQDSTIAAAAEAAYTSGSVTLALQGNQGPAANEVRCPANARKVMAVGAVDVTSQVIESYSSRGPSNDGRYKPDLVAPTNVRAAGSLSDTGFISIFNGTSGATPHAAGAAALLRNWLIGSVPNIEPGQIYAHLIASGNNASFDNTYGSGLLTMMTNSTWFAGKTAIASGFIDMPISVTGTVSRIDAALWWPEAASQHNDIDLDLLNPSGAAVAWSQSVQSVYEKIRLTTTTTGTWKVRVKWYSGAGSQPVYWAALQRY